jgi:hypothetical protein
MGAAGGGLRRPDAYRPPSRHEDPEGAQSARSGRLNGGAFVRMRDRRRVDLRSRERRTQYPRKDDVLSLTGFPDFLQGRAVEATGRSRTGLPDVRRVLGERARVDTGGGGADVLSFGQLPSAALSLVLLSSLLLIGALLPPGVVALTPVSPARFARIRQPLAVTAVAILTPLAVASLAAALL